MSKASRVWKEGRKGYNDSARVKKHQYQRKDMTLKAYKKKRREQEKWERIFNWRDYYSLSYVHLDLKRRWRND